jgi:uncharacterized delta-60 repeat protein
VAAGTSDSPNGDNNFALVRYHPNPTPPGSSVPESIDTTFGDNTQQPGRVLTDFRPLENGQRSTDVITAIAIQADGKIVAAGYSDSPNGDWNFALVRYNPNGVIDTSFGDNTQQPGRVLTDFRALADGRRSDDFAQAIALQADGKIVVAGRSNSPNGDDNFALVRYLPNGVIDTSFGDNTQQPGRVLTDFRGFTEQIRAIAVQADGKIVAAGFSNAPSGVGPPGAPALPQREAIIKAFRELAAEMQFEPKPKDPPPPGSSSRYIGSVEAWSWSIEKGDRERFQGQRTIIIEQYPNSERAEAFLSFFINKEKREVKGTQKLEPAKVGDHDGFLVTGRFFVYGISYSGYANLYLIWRCENLLLVCDAQSRLGAGRPPREQVEPQLRAEVEALAAKVDQKLAEVQACQPTQSGDENFALVRYTADGRIDTSFGDNTQLPGQSLTDFRPLANGRRSDDLAQAIALQADGKIVVAGKSNSPNGDDNFALVRYDANGVIDTSFSDSTQQPGRVLTDFRPLENGVRSTDVIYALAIQADGKIVAAGTSNSPNGDNNLALVRYHPNPAPPPGSSVPESIDTTFGDSTQQPGRVLTDFRPLENGSRTDDVARALAIQRDGKIVAAGTSNSPNGDVNFALVRYHGTSTASPSPGTTPTPPPPPTTNGKINLTLTLDAPVVKGGAAVTATVTLSAPAPASGIALYLESYEPGVASVPDSLTVPAGARSMVFTITTHPVSDTVEVEILVDFFDPDDPIAGDLAGALLTVTP